jgi:NitT/TauT family transport system substrate-binding protein
MRRMSRRPSSVVVLIASGVFALGACGGGGGGTDGGGGDGQLEQVTYVLGFAPNYVEAGFIFTALGQGLYEEAGLDVEYIVPESTQTAARLVGAGRADIGEYIGTDPVAAVGEGIPIKVATSLSWGELGLMANPGGPVQSTADLADTTVGVFGGLVLGDVCRPKLFEANGVDPGSVTAQDIGFTSVPPLLTKKVAASEGGKPFETEIYANEANEQPLFFSYSEVCPPMLQGHIINTSWAEENPDTARAFFEATLEGAKSFIEDPAEARRLFLKEFPDIEDPQSFYDAAAESFCGPEAAERGVGYNPTDEWERLIEVTREGGVIEESLDVSEVVTDDYLPEEPVTSSACA